jgi:hypothetical protein
VGAGIALLATIARARLPLGTTRLIGPVGWSAPGTSGTALFQGLATPSTLTGHLFAGDSQLAVTGTIGTGGAVTGTVAASDGTPVGTFAGTREGDTLRGTYELTDSAAPLPDGALASDPEAAMTWEADAGDVPVAP